MSQYKLSNLSEADIESAGDLFYDVFGPPGIGESWTKETASQHVSENSFRKDFCFVAREDGHLVGLLLAFPLARDDSVDLFVDTIAVLPNFQFQGIGKELLNQVLRVAQHNGLSGYRLLANPKLTSFKWYKKLGMKESGWIELESKISFDQ